MSSSSNGWHFLLEGAEEVLRATDGKLLPCPHQVPLAVHCKVGNNHECRQTQQKSTETRVTSHPVSSQPQMAPLSKGHREMWGERVFGVSRHSMTLLVHANELCAALTLARALEYRQQKAARWSRYWAAIGTKREQGLRKESRQMQGRTRSQSHALVSWTIVSETSAFHNCLGMALQWPHVSSHWLFIRTSHTSNSEPRLEPLIGQAQVTCLNIVGRAFGRRRRLGAGPVVPEDKHNGY